MRDLSKITFALMAGFLAATPLSADAAEEWGIDGEEKARFEAKVVDIACELTGNCPANCGGGKRQLGLLKDDGTLLITVKNQDIFAGTAADLAPHCGQRIVADGLLIKTKHMPMFALQFHRSAPPGKPKGKWSRSNQFGKDWVKKHGGKAGQWFRNDPRIKAEVAKNGPLGDPKLKLPKE